MRLVFILFIILDILYAHKLNLFVSQENNDVIVSSYFASGNFCKKCKVEVFDIDKKLLESGITNKEGEYSIKNNTKEFIVKVEAIGGHAVQKIFESNNLEAKKLNEKNKSGSLWQSLIAIFLLVLIFVFLKRVKK